MIMPKSKFVLKISLGMFENRYLDAHRFTFNIALSTLWSKNLVTMAMNGFAEDLIEPLEAKKAFQYFHWSSTRAAGPV